MSRCTEEFVLYRKLVEEINQTYECKWILINGQVVAAFVQPGIGIPTTIQRLRMLLKWSLRHVSVIT